METKSYSVQSFIHGDALEVTELISRRFAPVKIEPLSKDGFVSMAGRFGRLQGLDFSRTAFQHGFTVKPEKLGPAYLFFLPTSGAVQGMDGHHQFEAEETRAVCLNGDDLDFIRFASGYSHLSCTVEKPSLQGRLTLLLDRPTPQPIHFEPVLDNARKPLLALRTMIAFLTDGEVGQLISDLPLTATRMSHLLIDLVLEAWPHNFSDELRRRPPAITPKHVRIIKDYIDANPLQPLTSEEMARLAGVSIRALQYGFRDFLGLSISQYERQVRLNGARKAILAGDEIPIIEIARWWGFTNTHRFAHDFKTAFGLSPSDLRRNRF